MRLSSHTAISTNPNSLTHWHIMYLNSSVSISRCLPVEGRPLLVLQEPYCSIKICRAWLNDSFISLVAIPPRSLHASTVLCHHFHWYEEKLYSRYSHTTAFFFNASLGVSPPRYQLTTLSYIYYWTNLGGSYEPVALHVPVTQDGFSYNRFLLIHSQPYIW